MQANWKKPWTVLLWVLSREKFTPETGPGPESASRFGPRGFWHWLFASEEFTEEPAVQLHKPRFGDKGFFPWLFGSEWQSQPDDGDGSEDSPDSACEKKHAVN